jgi:2-succinyl-6-hydroxy-2,4-cyclohexadiene-1-carboxylate synthase
MKSVTVYHQQTRLQVWEGERNGEAILFLHPQGGTSAFWKKILPYFSDDFHIICMDLRGHGNSDRAASGYDIDTQCLDFLAVLDHLQVEKAHLVGCSLGGDYATFFAAKYPERTLSLSNVDSGMIDYVGPNGERELTKEEVLEEYRQRKILEFQNYEQIVAFCKDKWIPWDSYFEEWMQQVSIYQLDNGNITFQIPTHINVQIMETVCDLHYEEAYNKIQCPVLFLPAEDEPKLESKMALIERVKGSFPSKAVVIPQSKHFMPLNQPKQVSTEILTFLREFS